MVNPTIFVVDNPIESLLNFTHIKGSIVLKSNGFAKLASKLDLTTPPSNEVTFNLSPVLNLCPGRRIELGFVESIVAVLVNPVTILLAVLPTPTDLLYAIPSIVINEASKNSTSFGSIFLFSNFSSTLKVNSCGNLLTSESTLCALSTPLCFLTILYLLFKKSTVVIKISSFPIFIISSDLNFLDEVGSCNLKEVLIPVAAVFPRATVRVVLEVTTPTGLNPSMFL